MNIPWDMIFDLIKSLMENCRTNGEEAVIQEMRSPGPFTRFRLRRVAKQKGLTLTDEEWDAVFHRGATASQLELQSLVRDSWGAF